MAEAIKVVVRFRGGEGGGGETGQNLEDLQISEETIKLEERAFTYDHVLDQQIPQDMMYQAVAKKTVDSFLDGYNATIFAYGQSGSGKTYTMLGPDEVVDVIRGGASRVPPEIQRMYGVIPRATLQVFERINELTTKGAGSATLRVFYFEVYNQGLNNILTAPVQTNLKMREQPGGGIVVLGVDPEYVSCPEEIFELLQTGTLNRAVAGTNQNARSSRSHTMFVLDLEQNFTDGSKRRSRLNLVDLAGSERIEKTGAAGQTLEEAKSINQSLSCLGNCILALTTPPGPNGKKVHVPFRESKLTFFLKESLGGNAKTALVCTTSRRARHRDETIQTLRFAQRAKKIKNKAKTNIIRSTRELEAMVSSLQAETKALKAQLAAAGIAIDPSFKLTAEKTEELKKDEKLDEDIKVALVDLQARYDTLKEETELKIASLNEELIRAAKRGSRRISIQRSPSKLPSPEKEGQSHEEQIKTDSEDEKEEEDDKQQTDIEVELEQVKIALDDARLTITAKSQYIDEIETEIKAKEYSMNRKNTALSVKVKALEQEKLTAESIIEDYQKRLHEQESELNGLKEKCEGVQQALLQKEEQAKELDSQLLAKEAEIWVMKQSAAASKAIANENKKAVIGAKLHNSVLQTENKRQKAEIERLKEEQEQVNAQIKDLKESNDQLKQQNAGQSSQLTALLIAEQLMQNKVAEMETKAKQMQQKLSAELDMKDNTIKELTMQLVNAAGKVEKADAELKDKDERQSEAKSLIQTYTKKLNQQLEENLNLKKMVNQLQLKFQQKNKEAEDARLELIEGKHADALMKSKLGSVEGDVNRLKETIEQLKNERATQREEIEKLQEEGEKGLAKAEERFEQSIETLKEELSKMEGRFKEQKKEMSKEVEEARKEAQRQTGIAEELRRKLKKLEEENLQRRQAVEREVHEAQEEISLAKEELRAKSQQQVGLTGDLALAKQRLHQIEGELERAKAEAERKQRQTLQETAAAAKKKRRDTKPRYEVFGVVLKKTNSKFVKEAIKENLTKRTGPLVRDIALEERVKADQDWYQPKEKGEQQVMEQIDWDQLED